MCPSEPWLRLRIGMSTPTKSGKQSAGGRGRPPKCLARCFRAGCWAGTEDVPDCHLPGRRMECTHGIKTSVLSPVQLPVGVYRALFFLQNKEEL